MRKASRQKRGLMDHKLLVARAQLGAATRLFLDDMDPVSVHVLICGAAEVLEALAHTAGLQTVASILCEDQPDLTPDDLVKIRNAYWNAMKYFSTKAGIPRKDGPLLTEFSDEENDPRLFEAWMHYGAVSGAMPVEAQVFQMWLLSIQGLGDDDDPDMPISLFPGLRQASRTEQKDLLRAAIAHVRRDKLVEGHSMTETLPLLLTLEQYLSLKGVSS